MSGWDNAYYIIDYKESDGMVGSNKQNYEVNYDKRIIIENDYQKYDEHDNMQIEPLQITI